MILKQNLLLLGFLVVGFPGIISAREQISKGKHTEEISRQMMMVPMMMVMPPSGSLTPPNKDPPNSQAPAPSVAPYPFPYPFPYPYLPYPPVTPSPEPPPVYGAPQNVTALAHSLEHSLSIADSAYHPVIQNELDELDDLGFKDFGFLTFATSFVKMITSMTQITSSSFILKTTDAFTRSMSMIMRTFVEMTRVMTLTGLTILTGIPVGGVPIVGR